MHVLSEAARDYFEENVGGVLPTQEIESLIQSQQIIPEKPVVDGQIQPASLDLRLGGKAYRVRAGFLPGKSTVMDCVDELCMHQVDLENGGVLERGAVYIIPLMESVNLNENLSALASPKSSTGRLDVMTRLMTDYATSFDRVVAGYNGELFVEVSPLTFSVIARKGDRLTQIRLRRGHSVLSDDELRALDQDTPLVYLENNQPEPANIHDGLWLSVDLEGKDDSGIVGYRARKNAPLIDLNNIGYYDVDEFWEPLYRTKSGKLILTPEDFYIMASRERLRVPENYSSEMMPYETIAGELRVHYAGFFDPGFGCADNPSDAQGTTAVLEIRSHDVPFVLEHGQRICRMVYEHLESKPTKIYSKSIGSNYANQKLSLAKQFKR